MGRRALFSFAFLSVFAPPLMPQTAGADQASTSVSLTVASGTPLRLYLDKRLPKRTGAPANARLLEPVFAFDREVIPAGTLVLGRVSRIEPVSRMSRAMAIVNGDFTPLHRAYVEFTSLVFPDGRTVAIQTVESTGLNSIYVFHPPKKGNQRKDKNGPANGGILGTGKREVKARIDSTINAKTRGVADIVRGPDKKERLAEFLVRKLPYHPQWLRKGTRFDSELREPLPFGAGTFRADGLRLLGTQPPPDSVAHVRLLSPLNSATAKKGQPVEAVVTQPLFSPDHRLMLPEGTRLTGAVTYAQPARWFHRGGQLRFGFQKVDLPAAVAAPAPAPNRPAALRTQTTLKTAESGGNTDIQVDSEGGVKTKESKSRLIGPVVAGIIATKGQDNDAGRKGVNDSNAGGRTLAGGSGFGLLGAAAGRASRTAASALGFYGLAWSVYSTVVARGSEVEFGRNAAMDIGFGSRADAQPAHKMPERAAAK